MSFQPIIGVLLYISLLLPAISTGLADADRLLDIDGFCAAADRAPENVPKTEKDEPKDSPPPADKDPP